ncbi:MAG TPA: dihydrodipicolinate synthase family protein [Planctomycetes bacterium]|nr:dihydrodipicolinate synthase family protein [Planctomycetaceae bacterium]HIN54080.1 dihydrodipicolinate synthase family protein [Planctomycetota bacterium]
MSQAKLAGIFTPNIVCLDAQGNINERETRRYVDWLIDNGVQGLYPNGSTGEFTRFTAAERQRTIEIIADQVNGRVPILAGAAEANSRETIQACERYHELGATAVAIVAPFYYQIGSEAVYTYFKEIADNSPIDVTLYNIPLFASPIDVDTVARLADDCERVIGIKDSSGDLPQMMRMISRIRPNRPEFSFLTGWDPILVPMLWAGADGGTNASSGVVPELTSKIYQLASTGEWDLARDLQFRLLRLFDAMILNSEFPEGFREAIKLRGFDTGTGRQPQGPVLTAKLQELNRDLSTLLHEEGFTQAVNAGSTPSAAPIANDNIDTIVQGVLAELSRRGLAQ